MENSLTSVIFDLKMWKHQLCIIIVWTNGIHYNNRLSSDNSTPLENEYITSSKEYS